MAEFQEPMAHYTWDPALVSQVFSLVLRDPTFYPRRRTAILPAYFPDHSQRTLVAVVAELVEKYRELPNELVLRADVDKRFAREPKKLANLSAVMDQAYQTQVHNAAWLRDQVVDFGRSQAMTRALTKSVELLGQGNFDEIKKLVSTANSVGQHAKDFGHFYVKERETRIKDRSEARRWSGISTGFMALDRALDGGSSPGELYAVAAPPKLGKTTVLVNFAAAALEQGRRAIYYTMEVAWDILGERMDRRLLGRDKDYVRANPGKVSHLLDRHIESTIGPGEIVIKQFASGGAKVGDLTSHVHVLRDQEDFYPEIIFVDYADLLRWTGRYTSERHGLNEIYTDLRGMGQEFGCSVWTATQFSKIGALKSAGEATDVAESYGKVGILDALIGFSQTKDERKENRGRLNLLALRNAQANLSIPIKIDRDLQRIRAEGHAVENYERPSPEAEGVDE